MQPADATSRLPDPNDLSLTEFAQALRETGHPRRLIELARDEDLGAPPHDWTGELMFAPGDTRRVELRSRSAGVAAGLAFLPDLIEVFSAPGEIDCQVRMGDGDPLDPGAVLAGLSGDARAIVRLERTMLNLISRMSGVATKASSFVELVAGTGARVCDTRKTTPGLRALEKYAVRCGGGRTHRMGLFDAVLIKDNHLAGINPQDFGTELARVAYAMRERGARLWFVQIEVDTLDQLGRVLQAQRGVVDLVLLDNMSPDQLKQAVSMRDESGGGVLLEASGGVSERTVRAIAETGVDRVSIGAITHQATSLDLGLDAC